MRAIFGVLGAELLFGLAFPSLDALAGGYRKNFARFLFESVFLGFYSGWICALLLGQFGGHGRCVECWKLLGVHGGQSSDFAELNAGCVDLIYLDPPFGLCWDYAGKMDSVGEASGVGAGVGSDRVSLSEVGGFFGVSSQPAFSSTSKLLGLCWRSVVGSSLDFRGSLCLYCDAAASHYLKCVLDCILGRNNF